VPLFASSAPCESQSSYYVLMATSLEVRGLTVELPTQGGWVRPVNDVSFTLGEGETLGIVGESGSGKTMLSLALMGLEPHGARHTGEAWLKLRASGHGNGGGKQVGAGRENLLGISQDEMRELRGREIAMIFQEPMTALNPVLRIGAQIEEAIRVHEPRAGDGEIHRRALAALERAALNDPERRARQYPHQLSGGLRQRVMIAMALAARPGVLIADEPTTALDVTVQKQILELLANLRSELGLSMLFITHDLGVVAQVAGRVAVMYAGRIVEEGPVGEVLRAPRHPYTEGLLRAAPRLTREKLVPIPGTVPSLDALPPGCAFAPRCAHRVAECDAAMPELRASDERDGPIVERVTERAAESRERERSGIESAGARAVHEDCGSFRGLRGGGASG
jgi:oligopeptide/dipeptide ABC transporter ATP-binding protein